MEIKPTRDAIFPSSVWQRLKRTMLCSIDQNLTHSWGELPGIGFVKGTWMFVSKRPPKYPFNLIINPSHLWPK